MISLCMCLCIIPGLKCQTAEKVINYARISTYQLSLLEVAFANDYYINKTTLMQLIQQTGLNKKRIRNWFINKRTKVRHERIKGTLSTSEYLSTNRYSTYK